MNNNSYNLRKLQVKWKYFTNYSYLIIDKATNEAAIVDPAWELDKVLNTINESEAQLTSILLTHAHMDHVNLVNPLIRLFNPKIYMSFQEIEFYKFKCKNLNPVQDFEVINLGETFISCLLTPGHTPGSISYLLRDSLFSGDTVFTEGCGICYHPEGNPESMFYSIQRIKNLVDTSVHIYPGHTFGKEPGYTLKEIFDDNIYFQIEDKEVFIKFRMRTNQADSSNVNELNTILNFQAGR